MGYHLLSLRKRRRKKIRPQSFNDHGHNNYHKEDQYNDSYDDDDDFFFFSTTISAVNKKTAVARRQRRLMDDERAIATTSISPKITRQNMNMNALNFEVIVDACGKFIY